MNRDLLFSYTSCQDTPNQRPRSRKMRRKCKMHCVLQPQFEGRYKRYVAWGQNACICDQPDFGLTLSVTNVITEEAAPGQETNK